MSSHVYFAAKALSDYILLIILVFVDYDNARVMCFGLNFLLKRSMSDTLGRKWLWLMFSNVNIFQEIHER
jgi:hypothetical protein